MSSEEHRLPRRPLGARGPDITTLGFGSWAAGGSSRFGWSGVQDEESIGAIRFAVESGVNWVDTAAFYGKGHSERIVGKALGPWKGSDEVFIFTKCGLRWYSDDPDEAPENNLRPDSIRLECEQSLNRLDVEAIDLYQFHWPDHLGTPVEDSWATMMDLVAEGKVRYAGVSNFDVDLLERCQELGQVDSVQPKLNLLDRQPLDGVLEWCQRNGAGVLAYSPLASGLLSGSWNRERRDALADDDWRKSDPDFQEPRFSLRMDIVNKAQDLATRVGVTLAELAIAWVLAQRSVTGAIVGARTPEQVKGWLQAAELKLDRSTLEALDGLSATAVEG